MGEGDEGVGERGVREEVVGPENREGHGFEDGGGEECLVALLGFLVEREHFCAEEGKERGHVDTEQT